MRGWGSPPHNTHFDWQDRTPKEDREANIAGVMSWHVVVARNGCRVHVVANNGCRQNIVVAVALSQTRCRGSWRLQFVALSLVAKVLIRCCVVVVVKRKYCRVPSSANFRTKTRFAR